MLAGCTAFALGSDKLYIADLRTGDTIERNTCRGMEDVEKVVGVDEANSCFYTLQIRPIEDKYKYLFRTWDYSGNVVREKPLVFPEPKTFPAFSPDFNFAAIALPARNECVLYDILSDTERTIPIPYGWYGAQPAWIDKTTFVVALRIEPRRVGLFHIDTTNSKTELIVENPSFTEDASSSMLVSPDGHYLAFSNWKLVVVDLTARKALPINAEVFPLRNVLAWSPGSNRLAYATGERPFCTKIISIPDGEEVGKIEKPSLPSKFLDENRLLCMSGMKLEAINLKTGETESSIGLKGNWEEMIRLAG